MKHILLDNAYEAWKSAINFHDLIEKGITSFQNQKGFIASLHNATELFMKQMMLDANEHDVAFVRKIKIKADAQLMLNYFNSTDLNSFFFALNTTDIDKFSSIEFGQLIEKHKKIIRTSIGTRAFKEPLKLLQRLRNNETHFFINANEYLTEIDFVVLHNFMIDFYEVLQLTNLFPKAMVSFDKSSYHLMDDEHSMEFDRQKLTQFSYKEALKSNVLAQSLKNAMKDDYEMEYAANEENNYVIATLISHYHQEFAEKLDEVFVLLQLMRKYNLFSITSHCENINLSNGSMYTNTEKSFLFHF